MEPELDPRHPDAWVATLAAAQHGVVSIAQLRYGGLGTGAVKHRVATGRLHRLHRGVYAVGHRRLTAKARYMAAVLAYGDGAVLSHASAADLWGLRPSASARIAVTVPAHAGRVARPGILVHRSASLTAGECTELDGIPVTTPARTLLDLAGILSAPQLARAIDQTEALRLFDLRALHSVLAAHPGAPGTRALRTVLEDCSDPLTTRSELEDAFLELCAGRGLPRPAVNARVGAFEVDFLWREARVVVETDGHRHHGTRAAFERDRARDAQLTIAGYRVVRFTHRQVTRDGARSAAVVRALLAEGPM